MTNSPEPTDRLETFCRVVDKSYFERPQNPEPRVDRLETDMTEVKAAIAETSRNVSELRSTVATLADLVTIQQQQAAEDRALMLQLIQSIAQGGNGGTQG